MPPYLLRIDLRLDLADDAEAREYVGDEPGLKGIAEWAADCFIGQIPQPVATAKLQRLYTDRPPRLLAKWPPE